MQLSLARWPVLNPRPRRLEVPFINIIWGNNAGIMISSSVRCQMVLGHKMQLSLARWPEVSTASKFKSLPPSSTSTSTSTSTDGEMVEDKMQLSLARWPEVPTASTAGGAFD